MRTIIVMKLFSIALLPLHVPAPFPSTSLPLPLPLPLHCLWPPLCLCAPPPQIPPDLHGMELSS